MPSKKPNETHTSDTGAKKARKPSTRKPATKSISSDIWTPLNSRAYGYGTGFDGNLPPSTPELLTAFSDVAYAAIGLIAPNVAKECDKFKVVVSTGPRDAKPKSKTKQLGFKQKQRIEEHYPEYARRSVEIEEIVDHPVIDLFERPNPHQSFRRLVELIDVYLELVGSCFVYVNKLKIGTKEIPTGMWVLPSQYITIESDENGKLLGYRYQAGDQNILYPPEAIIHFRYTNPVDPYTGIGVSPVRAVWNRIMLLDKEQASWNAVLSNMTFPTVLISPPDNENYTPNQAQRIEKQLSEKGRLGGGQGGLWVVTEGMKVNPFITPPKDLSALQLYQAIRSSIATAMNVPLSMLDLNTEGAEASETIHRNFQRYCLAPRTDNILETFSHHLLPARMWLVVDNPVNPDKVFELQKATSAYSSGGIKLNEYRAALGYEPDEKIGNKYQFELMTVGTASAQTFQASAPTGRTKSQRVRYHSSYPNPAPLANALAEVFGKLSALALDATKNTTAMRTKAFFPLEDWTNDMKQTLTPILRAYYDEGLNAVFAALGGAPDLVRHDVLNLDDAVNRAVLALAKSTLDTTEQSVENAVAATREAIRNGLEHGEAHNQLAGRIKDVFTDLSTRRAVLIAETESSRAKHTGELIAIQQSGVEAKKKWIPDSMACPECVKVAAKGAIPLNEPFHVDSKGGPYSVIEHPPFHPQCRCTLQYDLGVNQ